MTIDKKQLKADELSKLIDALNNKEQVASSDPELQELADFALMVKRAAGQTKPAEQAIDDLAQQLKAESKGRPLKRRFGWLYSGAAGMAAAVMLVAVFNFAPVTQDNNEQLPQQVHISEVLPQPNTDTGSLNTQQNNTSVKAEAPKSTAQTQHVFPNRGPSVRTEQSSSSQAAKDAHVQAAQAGVMAARSTDAPAKQAGVFAIPGKNAKARSVDNNTGAIKQVYAFDNNKDVTITQKAKVSGTVNQDSIARAAIMKEAAAEDSKVNKTESANRVTAAKDEYEVTVEGELTKEELQEIADSLVETEDTPESAKE